MSQEFHVTHVVQVINLCNKNFFVGKVGEKPLGRARRRCDDSKWTDCWSVPEFMCWVEHLGFLGINQKKLITHFCNVPVFMRRHTCHCRTILNTIVIRYIFLVQLCSHPVAVVQYTVTHTHTPARARARASALTKYTERHKTNNTHRTTQNVWKSAGRAPSLRILPWYLLYN